MGAPGGHPAYRTALEPKRSALETRADPSNYIPSGAAAHYLTRSETRAECVTEPLAALLVPVIVN